MGKILLVTLLAAGATWASSIYQVEFVGTFDTGARASTFDLNGQIVQQNLSGFTVRGKVQIVIDSLPAPDPASSFDVGYETIGRSPLWLRSAEFSVDNLNGFPNTIFTTGPYLVDSAPVPADGTNLEPSSYVQGFGIIESLNFLSLRVSTRDSWTNPEFRTFLQAGIWNLNAQGLSGIPYDPATGTFQPISGTPSFSSGFVQFQSVRTVEDSTQGQLGMVENTFVSGSFRATSVTGDVVVPEPGTWWVGLSGLGLFAVARRVRQAQ